MLRAEYGIDPIAHPYAEGRECVPLKVRDNDDYCVHITGYKARFFTEATLPDFVKAQLGMLKAMIPKHPMMTDAQVHEGARYSYYLDPTMPELGFRLSPSYFVLSLTKDQVNILDTGTKGESNCGQVVT